MNLSVLKQLIDCVGEKWVLTDPGDLYLYSYDSALDRAMPSVVVLPANPEQTAAAVNVLIKNKIPYVARGAATSLCGGPVPAQGAAVIALSRLKKIGKLDKEKREIVVEPGVVNLRLQEAIASEGLFYPPDPGSQKACTIGGNVGTNAGGPHCLKYGVTSSYVIGLEMILPDGQVAQFRVDEPGYDVPGLMVGSEGTLGIVTRIRLKLLPKPSYVRTMLACFSTIEESIQSVTDIIAAGLLPATLEAMDHTIINAVEAFTNAGYPTDAEAVLLIEVDGESLEELDGQVGRIKEICAKNNSFDFRFAANEKERARLWEGRRGSYAAMARLAPNVLVEDGAVPRTKLPEALAKIQEIAEDAGLRVALLFHAGDGNLHPQIIFDERVEEQTKRVKDAGYKMLKACVDLGGTISGEHGIGIDKREAMKWLFTRDTLQLFRRIKNVFDPDNLCNPDKLIPLTGRLSAAPTEKPPQPVENSGGFVSPQDEPQLIQTIQYYAQSKTPFGVIGLGTKHRWRDSVMVNLKSLNKILEFDQGNLTVTAQCGTPVAEIRKAVEAAGQHLWIAGEGSVGGVIATRSSVAPPLRDLILEMRVLLPTGEVAKFGAKTMKNVAGYDAAKLLIGSWGTLGIIMDVTFRLFPYPAKKLEFEKPKPFMQKPVHLKIKRAFDPNGILSLRLATAKPGEEEVHTDVTLEEKKHLSVEDRFWL